MAALPTGLLLKRIWGLRRETCSGGDVLRGSLIYWAQRVRNREQVEKGKPLRREVTDAPSLEVFMSRLGERRARSWEVGTGGQTPAALTPPPASLPGQPL